MVVPPVGMHLEHSVHKIQWIIAVRVSREGLICSESASYDISLRLFQLTF